MTVIEQIQRLPLKEKLFALEAIWEGISREEAVLEVPQWHQDMLDDRERLIGEGKVRFIGWEDAKDQIKKAVQ